MKCILFFSLLFSVIASPVHAELTETDLENIRQILQEELQEAFRDTHVTLNSMHTTLDEIEASFDNINASFDSINRGMDQIQIMLWIATALIVVAGIVNWTYVLKLWRSR